VNFLIKKKTERGLLLFRRRKQEIAAEGRKKEGKSFSSSTKEREFFSLEGKKRNGQTKPGLRGRVQRVLLSGPLSPRREGGHFSEERRRRLIVLVFKGRAYSLILHSQKKRVDSKKTLPLQERGKGLRGKEVASQKRRECRLLSPRGKRKLAIFPPRQKRKPLKEKGEGASLLW